MSSGAELPGDSTRAEVYEQHQARGHNGRKQHVHVCDTPPELPRAGAAPAWLLSRADGETDIPDHGTVSFREKDPSLVVMSLPDPFLCSLPYTHIVHVKSSLLCCLLPPDNYLFIT